MSCHQTSRSSSHSTSWPVRRTTSTLSTCWPSSAGLADRLVDGGLQRGRCAAAVAAVGGDDDLGLAVGDPVGERVGREPAEDHRVRGADPRAGEHRDHGLGDHRHVDRDPVAGLHAELDERVGRLADLVLEVGVGDARGCRPRARRPSGTRPCRRPASTCRSTQLYAALSLPPTNHLANGGLFQSRTRSHFWSQSSRSACSAQNASRSASARSYVSAFTLALAASSAGGSKRRVLVLRLERVSSLMIRNLPGTRGPRRPP